MKKTEKKLRRGNKQKVKNLDRELECKKTGYYQFNDKRGIMKANNPMKVAHIIGKMWAGGVENVVFNYYREIDKNKIQFDFYYDEDSTVDPPEDLFEMGAKFIKLPAYQNILKYAYVLRRYLIKNNYKIVHSHLNTLSLFPLFVAKSVGVTTRIAHNHSVPGGKEWKRNTLKNFLKIFSKCFATDYCSCSAKAGIWLFGHKCYNDGQVKSIKNAIDFERFVVSENAKEKIKDKLNLQGKLVIGHVGRFTFAKNHNFLIRVFNEIRKLNKTAILLLVGDGELRKDIVREIELYNLKNNVIIVGKSLQPEIYYSVMDVAIFPSVFEGFSLTTIESQVSGVPVVISEAIPNEAVISTGYRYMNLDMSHKEWAQAAVNIVNIEMTFLDCHKEYDIKIAAPILVNWYLDISER